MPSASAASGWKQPDMATRSYLQRIAEPVRPGEPQLWPVRHARVDEARPAVKHDSSTSPIPAPAAPARPTAVRRSPAAAAHASRAPMLAPPPPPVAPPHSEALAQPGLKPVAAPAAPLPRLSEVLSHAEPVQPDEPPPLATASPWPTTAGTAAPTLAVPAPALPPLTAEPLPPLPSTAAAVGAPLASGQGPAEAPAVTRAGPTLGPRPVASQAIAPAPHIHIGTVEVRSAPAPAQAPQPSPLPAPMHAKRPSSEPMARGYSWRYGLIQG